MLSKRRTWFARPLLLGLMLGLSGCSQLGDPIDESISRNHYFGRFKNSVIFGYGGNCLGPGCIEIAGADVSTFRPLTPTYAIDQHHVFHEAHVIVDETPKSFRAMGGNYALGKSKAYFRGQPFLAHVSSFQTIPVGQPPGAGRAPGVEHYAKDKNAVYFRDVIVSHSPQTFRALSHGPYFVDGNHAYYLSGGINKVLSSDAAHFQIVKNPDGSDSVYVADSTSVYVFGRELHKADAKTFRVLCSSNGGATYAADALHLFKFDRLVAGMSPSDFSGSCEANKSAPPG